VLPVHRNFGPITQDKEVKTILAMAKKLSLEEEEKELNF
jgi:hypothetical protein